MERGGQRRERAARFNPLSTTNLVKQASSSAQQWTQGVVDHCLPTSSARSISHCRSQHAISGSISNKAARAERGIGSLGPEVGPNVYSEDKRRGETVSAQLPGTVRKGLLAKKSGFVGLVLVGFSVVERETIRPQPSQSLARNDRRLDVHKNPL